MRNKIKEKIIQSLIDQKDVFGDELFESGVVQRKTILMKKEDVKPAKTGAEDIKIEKIKIEKENRDTELFNESIKEWKKTGNLSELKNLICECTKCALSKTRNKFVFGSGNPNADVMIVGEGPGAEEDAQGLPFVGRAGKLLTDILKAINFERGEVYIANIIKCRPPKNRVPLPGEIEMCLPYLKKQIDLIKPKFILCGGLTASQSLLMKKESLTNMRGKVFGLENRKVMVTYHPAALLRNPNLKRGCWEDVQKFRKLYDESNS